MMTYYLDMVARDHTPSPVLLEELKAFVESLGAELCLRAIYIRGIMRRYKSLGFTCEEDLDRYEAQRVREKARTGGKTGAGPEAGEECFQSIARRMQEEGFG